MIDARGVERGWITRSSYGTLAAFWGLFVAYGSLIPFAFASVDFSEAVRRFSGTLRGPLFIDSRTDFVTNILLTVPLGYFALAALRTDRESRWRDLATALLVVPICLLFSGAVEFAQVFFPVRTDALSDVVAQAAGAVAGVLLWLFVGRAVTEWLRDSLQERERPALVQRLLLAYCVVFIVTQVMPLDLTLDLGQLARKYRSGRVLLVPFSYPYESAFEMAWDYVGDVVLNIPIGAAATLLWVYGKSRRGFFRALVLAAVAVGLIELAQVFVNSRVADTTDVITGTVGAAIGVWLATLSGDRAVTTSAAGRPVASARLRLVARAGVVIWALLLISYHWNPYNFTTDSEQVRVGLRQLFSVPFSSYYLGTEFHALTEMLRKFLLAAPLGALLRLSVQNGVPASRRRLIALFVATVGFALVFGIEFGQVFLPSRIADVTDALVAECGILAGSWIAMRLTA